MEKKNKIDNIDAFNIKYTITDPFGVINITNSNGKIRGTSFNPFTNINSKGGVPETPKPTPPTPPPPPSPPPAPAPASCIVSPINSWTCPPGRIPCYGTTTSVGCGKYTGNGLKCCSKEGPSPPPPPPPAPKPTPKHDASGHDYVPTPSPKPLSGKCEIGKIMPGGWEFRGCGAFNDPNGHYFKESCANFCKSMSYDIHKSQAWGD